MSRIPTGTWMRRSATCGANSAPKPDNWAMARARVGAALTRSSTSSKSSATTSGIGSSSPAFSWRTIFSSPQTMGCPCHWTTARNSPRRSGLRTLGRLPPASLRRSCQKSSAPTTRQVRSSCPWRIASRLSSSSPPCRWRCSPPATASAGATSSGRRNGRTRSTPAVTRSAPTNCRSHAVVHRRLYGGLPAR
jgi:hypothetical protein